MRFGVDVDGVLADFVGGFRDAMDHAPRKLTEKQARALREEPETWYSIKDVVGNKNWSWFWKTGVHELEVFANLQPIGNELEWLKRLCLQADVYLLTSRPLLCAWQTYSWLARHQLSPHGVIHVGKPEQKVGLVQALDLDVFVDDKAETCAEVWIQSPLTKVYVFDAAHNQGLTAPIHGRIKSLEELYVANFD